METTIENITFKSTHKYRKYSISFNDCNGGFGTLLLYFEPCIGEEFWRDEAEKILKELLKYIFKNPEEFMNHWKDKMPIQEIKDWVINADLWGMEFRLHTDDSTSSGPWYKWYMNDNNQELKELSESFKNYFK